MARLKPQIHNFLNQIFEPTRYMSTPACAGSISPRGPSKAHRSIIDRIAGATSRGGSLRRRISTALARVFFSRNLITSHHRRSRLGLDGSRRRARALIIKSAALSLIGLIAID